MSLDLRKLELLIVGIHLTNLISRRSTKHFNDLDELVDAAVTREYRLTK